jgi:transposase-like protein
MYNYPVDQQEFEILTASEESCRLYLEKIRWPKGFVCPACGSIKAWKIITARWECHHCGRQTSVIAGTLFQDTRYPLHIWFQAIWYVTGQKNGTSALGLQKILGLGSYHTAWSWLHRIRRAMVCPGRDLLKGTIQVDETLWGSSQAGKRGRGSDGKTLIFIAIEWNDQSPGRVRLMKIPDASGKSLISAINNTIEEKSTIETDGWRGYNGLRDAGYQHKVIRMNETEDLLPQVHLIASLLKRWLLGTHQGGIRESHLDYYLDEFTFRFNRRKSRSRGLLFQRVLENALHVLPIREVDLQGKH